MVLSESSFRRWYEQNKDKVAERRKRKYEQDEEYRKKRLAEAKRYYWMKKRRAEAIDARRIDVEAMNYEPDSTLSVLVSNPEDIRAGMTVMVPVYRPSSVAKLLDRSVQTLRLWGLKGLIPEVTYRAPGGTRLYTEDQFKVLAENRHLLEFPTKKFEDNPFFAAVREGWAELEPDGIEPMKQDEWRLDPTPCPWCGAHPSLQFKNAETRKWEHVPCFECADPVEVDERKEGRKTVVVRAECPACEMFVEEEQRVVGEIRVHCPRCGRKITDFEVE